MLLAVSPAGAAEIDPSKGQLKHVGDVLTPVIAAKNNTAVPILASTLGTNRKQHTIPVDEAARKARCSLAKTLNPTTSFRLTPA
jgi:hypothetical protein